MGEENVYLCNQVAEHRPPKSRSSVLYETICKICYHNARNKKDSEEIRFAIRTMYVKAARGVSKTGACYYLCY